MNKNKMMCGNYHHISLKMQISYNVYTAVSSENTAINYGCYCKLKEKLLRPILKSVVSSSIHEMCVFVRSTHFAPPVVERFLKQSHS